MKMVKLLCAFNRHRPGAGVTWDGETFIGGCRHCERPIKRVARRKWRFDPLRAKTGSVVSE
jgi:hypothetical protein